MGNICQFMRALLVLGMVFGLAMAVVGAVALALGLIIGLLVLGVSSPAVVPAIFAHPTAGGLAVFGLVTLLLGLSLFFLLAVLYVLASLLCAAAPPPSMAPPEWLRSLVQHRDPKDAPARDGCEDDPLCRFGPLLPAGAFLALALVVLTILIVQLGVAGATTTTPGAGLAPGAVLAAATVVLVAFGLLLALAPIIWCCCCKPRSDRDELRRAGDAVLRALSERLSAILKPVGDAIGGGVTAGIAVFGAWLNANMTATHKVGHAIHEIGDKLMNWRIHLPHPDPSRNFEMTEINLEQIRQIGVVLNNEGRQMRDAAQFSEDVRVKVAKAAENFRTAADTFDALSRQ